MYEFSTMLLIFIRLFRSNKMGGESWTVNRKYKQFFSLHNELAESYPSFEISQFANQFSG
jgi:hypothetical protein